MDRLKKLRCNMMRLEIEVPPFSPSLQFLLGTDRKGYDLLHLVIEGAKWTIGISILIAALRMVIGVFFGVILGTYVKRGFSKIEAFLIVLRLFRQL